MTWFFYTFEGGLWFGNNCSYQARFSTETICLLINFNVTSYFSFRSDISRHVENLKFRKHADSITFIWSIACWLPVNDHNIEKMSSNRFMRFMMDDLFSRPKYYKFKRYRKVSNTSLKTSSNTIWQIQMKLANVQMNFSNCLNSLRFNPMHWNWIWSTTQ